MDYRKSINKIVKLGWPTFNPAEVGYLSIVSAQEFGESFRLGKLHARIDDYSALEKIAKGELNTMNLRYGSYKRPGDHGDFLKHFFVERGLFSGIRPQVYSAGKRYLDFIQKMSPQDRLMTVLSRESELPQIFEKILEALESQEMSICVKFDFFIHYLTEHIKWDSQESGHGDLAKKVLGYLDEDVLGEFYEVRLKMYQFLI